MLAKKSIFTKKRAVLLVLLCAAIISVFLFLRWHGDSGSNFKTPEGRQKFLENIGWEIDLSSESVKRVIIPEKFEGVMEDYNKMQQEQGLDLMPYSGKECSQYTYSLLNYPDQKENVYISIYIINDKLIAGDIHTNSVNGFMQGIFPSEH